MSDLYFFKPKSGEIAWETAKPVEWLLKNEGKKCWAELGRETGVRSPNQNAALHKLYEQLAYDLNSQGLTIQKVLAQTMELDWNKNTVKDLIWRPTQIALTNKRSTTELDRVSEINEIYEHVNRFISQFGVHVPFPSQHNE